jgi:hypothetical protein
VFPLPYSRGSDWFLLPLPYSRGSDWFLLPLPYSSGSEIGLAIGMLHFLWAVRGAGLFTRRCDRCSLRRGYEALHGCGVFAADLRFHTGGDVHRPGADGADGLGYVFGVQSAGQHDR